MALQGPIPVEFGVVFPSGAYAAGAFEPVRNFDASTGEKFVQSNDKATGLPLWVIEVIDPDPQARTRAVKVKVAAQAQPVIPAAPPGSPFVPVEFTGLTVTPYVNQAGRLAYSVKATGIRRARAGPSRRRGQGGSGMKSGGGSSAHVGMYVGEDWQTFLSTYEDHTPILDVTCGSASVSLSVADRKTGRRRWSSPGTWPARRPGSPLRSSGCTPRITSAARPARPAAATGMVRRPDGDRGWGGRNGHSCRPGCLPLLAYVERS